MSNAVLNLVVLRARDLDRSTKFYGLLGLALAREKHGSGPEHLTSRLGATLLEIYPTAGTQETKGVRLGFQVSSVVAIVDALREAGVEVITPPTNSPWGLRAVVADPDGHRIELTEARAD